MLVSHYFQIYLPSCNFTHSSLLTGLVHCTRKPFSSSFSSYTRLFRVWDKSSVMHVRIAQEPKVKKAHMDMLITIGNFNILEKMTTFEALTRVTRCSRWGAENGKCETLRDGKTSIFLCKPKTFDFLDCETETLKCFGCERETFRLLKFEPQIGSELWEVTRMS